MVRKPENRTSGICQIKLYCAVVDHRSSVYQLQLHYILLAGPRRRRSDGVIPRALDRWSGTTSFKRMYIEQKKVHFVEILITPIETVIAETQIPLKVILQ